MTSRGVGDPRSPALNTEPVAEGPLYALPLPVGRMEMVAASVFGEALPGEPVPAARRSLSWRADR
jgi:hypothetical protein